MPHNIPAILENDSFTQVNNILGLAFLFALLAFIMNLVNFFYMWYWKDKILTKKIIKEYLEDNNNSSNSIDWIVFERRIK